MQSANPFIKLMILGRINTKVKTMLKKKELNEIDVKLLKGLFMKKGKAPKEKKSIF